MRRTGPCPAPWLGDPADRKASARLKAEHERSDKLLASERETRPGALVLAAADAETGIRALRTARWCDLMAGRVDLDGLRARADADADDDEPANDRRSGGLKAPSDGTQPSPGFSRGSADERRA